MYEVRNQTHKTIRLNDLNVELKPRQRIDLELLARRSNIDESRDLIFAKRNGNVKILRHTPSPGKGKTQHVGVKGKDIEKIVRTAIDEHGQQIRQESQKEIKTVQELLMSIREKINSVGNVTNIYQQGASADGSEQPVEKEIIDPEKLAELRTKATDSIREKMESTPEVDHSTTVTEDGQSISDLADEL